MIQILKGKPVADKMLENVKNQMNRVSTNKAPQMDIILVGNNPASEIYVRHKLKKAESIGINAVLHKLDTSIGEDELLELINKLNGDKKVNGFIVQLPLPTHINENKVLNAISPLKDIDGFHPLNMGALLTKTDGIFPATPSGIMKMLEYYNVELEGKDAVVIGRSNIVGKPMALMLLYRNATVTLCHSRTKNLSEYTKRADIIISAVGKPGLITEDIVKENAVIIDVGTTKIGDRLMGDVDFDNVIKKASVSPVPGGVGPVTIASLIYNLSIAVQLQAETKAKEKSNKNNEK